PRTNQEEILAHIYRIDGNHTAEIPQAAAGEIIGLMKLRDVHVGDTLTAADAPPMRLEVIGKPQRVISYALKIDREQEEKAGVADTARTELGPSSSSRWRAGRASSSRTRSSAECARGNSSRPWNTEFATLRRKDR